MGFLLRSFVVLLLGVLLGIVLTPQGQRHIIYLHAVSWPPIDLSLDPSLPQWPFYEGIPGATAFTVVGSHGEHLGCWRVPGHGADHAVVYLHGNGAHRGYDHRVRLYRRLAGYPTVAAVYTCDYRGFAGQEGVPSPEGLRNDTQSIVQHVAQALLPTSQRIVLWGHSLGSHFAAHYAAMSRRNATPHLAALVLEAPFTSLARVSVHYVAPLLKLLIDEDTAAALVSYVLHDPDELDTSSVIGKVTAPVFFVHGKGDRVVPHEMSTQLAAAATGSPQVQVTLLEGASHNECVSHDDFDEPVKTFFASLHC